MSFSYTGSDLLNIGKNKSVTFSYSAPTLTVTSEVDSSVQTTPGIIVNNVEISKLTTYRFRVIGKKNVAARKVFLYIGEPGGETYSTARDVVLTTTSTTVDYEMSTLEDKVYSFGVLIEQVQEGDSFEVSEVSLEAVLPGGIGDQFVSVDTEQTITGNKFFVGSKNVVGGAGTSDYSLNINSTSAVLMPKGTTDQRPSTATAGLLRYNTTLGAFEGYSSGWGNLIPENLTINSLNVETNATVDGLITLNGGLLTVGSTNQLDLIGNPTSLTSGALTSLNFTSGAGYSTAPYTCTSTGYYVRIGALCYINMDLTLDSSTGGVTPVNVTMGADFPFTFKTASNDDDTVSCAIENVTYPTITFNISGGGGGQVSIPAFVSVLQAIGGTKNLNLRFVSGRTSSWMTLTDANLGAGGARLYASGFFLIDT